MAPTVEDSTYSNVWTRDRKRHHPDNPNVPRAFRVAWIFGLITCFRARSLWKPARPAPPKHKSHGTVCNSSRAKCIATAIHDSKITVPVYVMKADDCAYRILEKAFEISRHGLSFKGGACLPSGELEELAAALPFTEANAFTLQKYSRVC